MSEKTLVILKPDAVRRNLIGEIITRFEKKNLHIINMRWLSIAPSTAKEHYKHIEGRDFFPAMIDYMCSGPSLVVVLEGANAVSIVRMMLGKTRNHESPPGTIRGDYGFHDFENLVHASDSPDNAEIEIRRFIG